MSFLTFCITLFVLSSPMETYLVSMFKKQMRLQRKLTVSSINGGSIRRYIHIRD